jgi:hypothetical protein
MSTLTVAASSIYLTTLPNEIFLAVVKRVLGGEVISIDDLTCLWIGSSAK